MDCALCFCFKSSMFVLSFFNKRVCVCVCVCVLVCVCVRACDLPQTKTKRLKCCCGFCTFMVFLY